MYIMNTNPHTALRRALAVLLALLLAASLPALAEDAPLELDDAPALEVDDAASLSIDALPELSGEASLNDIDLSLSEDIDLALSDDVSLPPAEAESDGDADNTSKPMPQYKAMNYKMTMVEDGKLTINKQDVLRIFSKNADIASWTVSKDNLVKVNRQDDSRNTIVVDPIAVGSVNIAIKLTNGTQMTLSLTIEDAYALKRLSFSKKSATLLVGQDIDLKQLYVVEPVYANYNIDFTTSDKNIARMSRDCVVTAVKPGKVTVTVASDNGLKAKMNVVVKANCTGALHTKPTAKAVAKLAKKWTLQPKSLEMKGDGSIVCQLWLLNGSAGKLTAINNLDLSVSMNDNTGDTPIARNTFKVVKVDCAENKWQTVTLTFPAKSISCPALSFPNLKAKDLSFKLYSTPGAASTGKVKKPAYLSTAIASGASKNPVKYRALLVSESDFYNSHEKDPAKRWERIKRNKGDVALMKAMLGRVKTPDGGKYQVTTENNTTASELKQLVKKTFAGANKNDVSLFFIATHGDSSDSAAEKYTGALCMASHGEVDPDWVTLAELRDMLLEVPGKVIVILESCGSGAAVYKANDRNAAQRQARAAEAFDRQAVEVFRSADPGVIEGDDVPNTGDLRKVNKFYVLTAAAYREESWGSEPKAHNDFTVWLCNGVGKSGAMPADKQFSGNENGTVDLHELYRYISGVGDRYQEIDLNNLIYFQHVQVYPSDLRFPLFK